VTAEPVIFQFDAAGNASSGFVWMASAVSICAILPCTAAKAGTQIFIAGRAKPYLLVSGFLWGEIMEWDWHGSTPRKPPDTAPWCICVGRFAELAVGPN
jgi:hypothetical protein